MVVKDGKIYYSLREIAPQSPYSADYLRIRILQKKIEGVKIGREWYTTQDWLNDYLSRYAIGAARQAHAEKFPIRFAPEKQFVPLDSVQGDLPRGEPKESGPAGEASEAVIKTADVSAPLKKTIYDFPAERKEPYEIFKPAASDVSGVPPQAPDTKVKSRDLDKIFDVSAKETITRRSDYREFVSNLRSHFSPKLAAFPLAAAALSLLLFLSGLSSSSFRLQNVLREAAAVRDNVTEFILTAAIPPPREIPKLAVAAFAEGVEQAQKFAAKIGGDLIAAAGAIPTPREIINAVAALPENIAARLETSGMEGGEGIESSLAKISFGGAIDKVGDFFRNFSGEKLRGRLAQWFSFESPSPVGPEVNVPRRIAPLVKIPALESGPQTQIAREQISTQVREIVETKEVIQPADVSLFQAKLDELNAGLRGQVLKLVTDVAGLYTRVDQKTSIVTTFAPSQKIDELHNIKVDSGLTVRSGDLTVSAGTFSLSGGANITGDLSVSGASGVSGNSNIGGVLSVTGSGTSTISNGFTLATSGGAVGIGTTSPAVNFAVAGHGYFTGGLGVGFATTGSGQLHVTGPATFERDFIHNGRFINTSSATSSFSGNLLVSGNIQVTGNEITVNDQNITGALNVTGNATLGDASSDIIVVNGLTGFGTTSPWGQVSIDAIQGTVGQNTPIFVVADQGTSTPFFLVHGGSGNVGIGTSSPSALLAVNAPANQMSFMVGSSTEPGSFGTTSTSFIIDEKGSVGIGTSKPKALLHIRSNVLSNSSTRTDGAKMLIDCGQNCAATYEVRRLKGGFESPTAVVKGDNLGFFGASGYGSTGFPVSSTAGYLQFQAASTFTDSVFPTRVMISASTLTSGQTERIRFDEMNQVGVSTTSPGAKFAIAAATDTPAFLLDQTGTGDIFNLLSNGVSVFKVMNGGLVGIGTTSPGSLLSVAGQCVTGDTRLRRRRRRKSRNLELGYWSLDDDVPSSKFQVPSSSTMADDYIYDEVAIVDIQPGDEIASLDEETGRIVWSKVNALLDMGVKDIFELTTESGKRIRTTASHPYFVRASSPELPKKKPRLGIFFDNANMFYAQKEAGWKVDFVKLRRELSTAFDVQFIYFYIALPAENDPAREATIQYLASIEKSVNIKTKALKYISAEEEIDGRSVRVTHKKGDMDVKIVLDVVRRLPELDAVMVASGDSDFLDLAKYVWEKKKKIVFAGFESNMAWELRRLPHLYLNRIKNYIGSGATLPKKNTAPSQGLGVVLWRSLYSRPPSLSSGGVWKKVVAIREGMQIAVRGNNMRAMWDQIVKIRRLPPEQVYDIEVEGTHNFIGNDIVAHNTLIRDTLTVGGTFKATSTALLASEGGSVGIGTTTPGALLSIKGPFLANGTSTIEGGGLIAEGLFSTSSLAFYTASNATPRMIIKDGGNVGIGTAGPTAYLHIVQPAGGGATGLNIVNNAGNSAFIVDYGIQGLYIDGTSGLRIDPDDSGGNVIYQATSGRTLGITTNAGAITFSKDAGSTESMRVATTGNLGIGTTSPGSLLSVAGHCVVGNTRLRIRRRRRKFGDGSWELGDGYDYFEIEIKNIQPNKDEVLSLNEKTGLLEYQPVQALWDMGVKPIYELITETGKKIRTTGNHPYLARLSSKFQVPSSHWVKVSELREGNEIAAPKAEALAGFAAQIKDKSEICQKYNRGNYIKNVFVHIGLFFTADNRNPHQDHEREYADGNVELKQSHNSIFSAILVILIAVIRNVAVAIMPKVTVGQGIFPVILGSSALTTAEPNIILAPSRKKSDRTFSWLSDFIFSLYQGRKDDVKWEKIVSLTGKTIRTTGNHPYLARLSSKFQAPSSHWVKVAELREGNEIAVPKLAALQAAENSPELADEFFRRSAGDPAKEFAYESLVKRNNLRRLYERWKEKTAALAICFLQAVGVLSAFFGVGVRGNGKKNDIFLRSVEVAAGDNKGGPLFCRGEVGEGERHEHHVAGIIGCCIGHRKDCPKNQTTVRLSSATPNSLLQSEEAGAGVVKNNAVHPDPLFGSFLPLVLARVREAYRAYINVPSFRWVKAAELREGVEIGAPKEGALLAAAGFRAVEKYNAVQNNENGCRNDVENNSVHKNLVLAVHGGNKNNRHDDADDHVSNKKLIGKNHNYFANNILAPSAASDTAEPKINTGTGIAPTLVGMKKPTTTEAISILDISARYFESISIWSLLNRIGRWYNNTGDDVKWEKIVSLKRVGWEQVWDITVKGTHNFIAGHYINTRTGKALTQEQEEIVALRQELGTWNLELSNNENIIKLYEQRTAKLRKIRGLARKYGVGEGDLSADEELSQGRAIRNYESGKAGNAFGAAEYRGGSEPQEQNRFSAILTDSNGVAQRNSHDTDALYGFRNNLGNATETIAVKNSRAHETHPSAKLQAQKSVAERLIQVLSSKLQVPELNFVEFGGIVAHNTVIRDTLTVGGTFKATSTALLASEGGSVGIGTTTPGAMLSVKGPFLANGTSTIEGGGLIAEGLFSTSSLAFYTASNATPKMIIKDGGNVDIGTVFHVVGSDGQTVIGGVNDSGNGMRLFVRGTVTPSSGAAYGILEQNTLVPPVNSSAYGLFVQPTFTEAASGQPTIFAAAYIDAATVNAGVSNPLDTASLYIKNAMTATVDSGNPNYALWVDDGVSRFDGLVGIGTTSPGSLLSVAGQCVVGDTRLRIRRRRRKKSALWEPDSEKTLYEIYEVEPRKISGVSREYEYLEIEIKNVESKDEVLSLNEKTGAFEYHRIEQLWDMGVKPVYKITTASGRTITTTGNHPYLARKNPNTKGKSLFERGLVQTLESPYYLDSSVELGTWNLELSDQALSSTDQTLAGGEPEWIKVYGLAAGDEIAVPAVAGNQKTAFWAAFGDSTLQDNTEVVVRNDSISNQRYLSSRNVDNHWSLDVEGVAPSEPGRQLQISLLSTPRALSSYQTSQNQSILFDRIASIQFVGTERVYDITVEGTHNFIGNDIVAHNTLIVGTTTAMGGVLTPSISATGTLGFYTTGTAAPRMVIDSSGNLGIGITAPGTNLEVVNSSAATTTPLFISNLQSGTSTASRLAFRGYDVNSAATTTASIGTAITSNVTLRTTADLQFLTLNAGTLSEAARFSGAGFLGLGTTSPGQLLSVAGHCVTGDTRLRRRRRRRKLGVGGSESGDTNDEYIYDEVPIKDAKEGDEIASLDEKTGRIVWSKVNALLDMGVKPIYKLTTASGKTIRTTAEHPYLVKISAGGIMKVPAGKGDIGPAHLGMASEGHFTGKWDSHRPGRHVAAGSLSNAAPERAESFSARGFSRARVGIFIDSSNLYHASKKAEWQISLNHLKQLFVQAFDVVCANCYVVVPREDDPTRPGMLAYAKAASRFFTVKQKPLKYIIDQETGRELKKGDVDLDLSMDVMRVLPYLDAVVVMSGDSDYLALAAYTKELGIPAVFMSYKDAMAWELRLGDHLFIERIRQSIDRGETITNPRISAGAALTSFIIDRAIRLSRGVGDNTATTRSGIWTKVMHVREGQEIAIASDDGKTAIWNRIEKIEHLPEEQVYDIEVEGTHNFIGNDIVAHNTLIRDTLTVGGTFKATSTVLLASEGGSVGIGTTSPVSLFAVQGNSNFAFTVQSGGGVSIAGYSRGSHYLDIPQSSGIRIGTSTNVANGNFAINIQEDGGDLASISLRNTGAQGDEWILSSSAENTSAVLGGGAGNGGKFNIYQRSGNVSVFTINSSRNVGIGQTNPKALLTVGNAIGTGDAIFGGDLFIYGGDVNLGTGSATTTISGNGTGIGIGTTTPGAMLSVKGPFLANGTSTIEGGGLITGGLFSTSSLAFYTQSNATPRMIIKDGGNVGIGTTSPSATLAVNGTFYVPDYVTFNNGALRTSVGYQTGTAGNNNSAFGYQALKSVAAGGNSNTALGVETLYTLTTGTSNTAVGYQTLYYNLTGTENTAIGSSAAVNTTGNYNTAVGVSALSTNTSASENTAIGRRALYSSTGSFNTAVGSGALYTLGSGTESVGVGYNTAFYTTGSKNAVVGSQAGTGVNGVSTYANSTLLGYKSGFALTTGSNNILLGYQAGDNLTTGANNIIIGYDIDAPAVGSANTLNIGNLIFATGVDGSGTTLSTGSVGIGTTTPGSLLAVNGSFLAQGTSTILGGGLNISALQATDTLAFYTSGTAAPRMVINSSGNLGIGIISPGTNLEVVNSSAATTTPLFISNLQSGTSTASRLAFRGYDVNSNATTTASIGTAITSNLAGGTSADLQFLTLNSGTLSEAARFSGAGFLGLGTTSPGQLLSVAGHCVTGDTRLRRRRRRRRSLGLGAWSLDDPASQDELGTWNLELSGQAPSSKLQALADSEYIYDEVAIRDIQPGDEIASLNEKTGRIVWSKVNGLLDMGVKPIYKLTTASGKTIRTTAEHPYLVRVDLISGLPMIHFNDVEKLRFTNNKFNAVVAFAQPEGRLSIALQLFDASIIQRMRQFANFPDALYGLGMYLKRQTLKFFERCRMEEIVEHKKNYRAALMRAFNRFSTSLAGIQELLRSASLARLSVSFTASGLDHSIKSIISSNVSFETIRVGATTPRSLPSSMIVNDGLIIRPNRTAEPVSLSNGRWMKVMRLEAGVEIAIASQDEKTAVWDRIIKIEHLPAEQVYDIEVEGTHNFVAGHYLDRRTGKALTEEQEEIVALRQELGTWNLGLGNNENNITFYEQRTAQLRKVRDLARKHGVDERNLSSDQDISQGRTIWDNQPTSEGDTFSTAEYRRGPRAQEQGGLLPVSPHSNGLAQRDLDSHYALSRSESIDRGSTAKSSSENLDLNAAYASIDREIRTILQVLSSKLQVPFENEIIFGGIVAHNTLIRDTLTVGGTFKATSTALLASEGGSVGIGTTSPGSMLSIKGPFLANGTSTIEGGGLIAQELYSTTSLAFYTSANGTPRMKIDESGNVGIGTTSPNNLLSVYEYVDFNNTDFNTKLGYQAGKNIVSGAISNIFIGYQAGFASTTASTNAADNNTIVGYQSFYSNTTGVNNSAFGYNTLYSNTTGYQNSAFGIQALYSNTTGAINSAFGVNTLYSNTTGNYNSTFGASSLYSNTTGGGNSAFGYVALNGNTTGNSNSAFGYQILYSNTTGYNNSASGYNALFSNTTGYNNSAYGSQAGYNTGVALQTNNNSVFIGNDANSSVDGLTNAIAIGSSAQATQSNQVVLGNTSITQTLLRGDVGIGTSSPYSLLTLYKSGATAAASPQLVLSASSTVAGLGNFLNNWAIGTDLADGGKFKIASSTVVGTNDRFVIDGNGNVGIGTTTPGSMLSIKGPFLANGTSTIEGGGLIAQGLYSTTSLAFYTSSNIAPRVTIDNSGNLGIGTTSPSNSTVFGVAGTAYISGGLGIGKTTEGICGVCLLVKGQAIFDYTGTLGIIMRGEGGANTLSLAFDTDDDGRFFIQDQQAGARNMTFMPFSSGGGFIGIGEGTTSPAGMLGIHAPSGTSTPAVIVNNAGTGDLLTLQTSGVTSFVVQNNGRTGIGTTSPSQLLSVHGNSIVSGAGFFGGTLTATSSAYLAASGGSVGIGTTSPLSLLNVHQSAIVAGTSTPMFRLDTNDTADASKLFMVFTSDFDGTEDTEFAFLTNGRALADESFSGGGADVAEYMTSAEAKSLEPGDIVMVDGQTPITAGNSTILSLVKKAFHPAGSGTSSKFQVPLLGIISTRPGLVAGAGGVEATHENDVLVALAGRVPVKVSLEGGEIKPGDRIALSSAAGVGMKATTSGQVVGIALEPFDDSSPPTEKSYEVEPRKPYPVGKIMVFVNLGYSRLDSEIASAASGDFAMTGGIWSVDQTSGKITTIYGLDLSGQDIVNVRSVLSANGEWGIDENGRLSGQEVVAREKLQVGTPESPKGITLFDFSGGNPYCVFVQDGQVRSVAGECTFESSISSQQTADSRQQTAGSEQETVRPEAQQTNYGVSSEQPVVFEPAPTAVIETAPTTDAAGADTATAVVEPAPVEPAPVTDTTAVEVAPTVETITTTIIEPASAETAAGEPAPSDIAPASDTTSQSSTEPTTL